MLSNSLICNIRLGRLRKGLKLPGTREVAAILDINRMIVVAAYDELQAQGWIEMIPKKVCDSVQSTARPFLPFAPERIG